MITNAALRGEWVAPDGKTIKLPQSGLTPNPEIESSLLGGLNETLASQIFQLITINDITQRTQPPVYYSGKNGDWLNDAQGNPIKSGGQEMRFNGLPPFLVEQAGERNFADSRFFLINEHALNITKTGLNQFGTNEQLEGILSQNKEFPLIIAVDGRKLFGELGVPNHAILITGYNPSTKEVTLADPNFPSITSTHDLQELFDATT
jgi:hypothetical protein